MTSQALIPNLLRPFLVSLWQKAQSREVVEEGARKIPELGGFWEVESKRQAVLRILEEVSDHDQSVMEAENAIRELGES